MKKQMTSDQFDAAFEAFALETEYGQFIMANGDRPIGNGDMLLAAMEDLYMYEDFRASLVAQ